MTLVETVKTPRLKSIAGWCGCIAWAALAVAAEPACNRPIAAGWWRRRARPMALPQAFPH
ncbi:MAG: hypothetical protein O3A37_01155 [Planctomycetota bacterium]|nr:hypothetical protein [Planctomycetota bacterium]